MGDLSKHFSRSEFKCHCGLCDFDTVDAELVLVLEDLRTDNVRVNILSGCRCPEHNEAVQFKANPNYIAYSSDSEHMYSLASDITVERQEGRKWVTVPPEEVATELERKYPDKYGIGRYNWGTHIDVRKKKARWNYAD